MGKYFDVVAAAEQAGLTAEQLAALRRRIEADYRSDILREMHLHRLCTAIARGRCTLEEALTHQPDLRPAIKDMRVGG